MPSRESCLLEIVETGPCTIKELVREAPSLMSDEIGMLVWPSEIQPSLDKLNSLGMIGLTGARLDIVVSA